MASARATRSEMIQKAFEQAARDCTVPPILILTEPFPSIGITYHKLITIIAAVATILCCLVSLFTTLGHLLHWINPQERKQIVRIVLSLPVFAIFTFFSIWFYDVAGYLGPIPQIYEAFAIVALFYLYVVYVSPNDSTREQFNDDLERRKRSGKLKHGNSSLRWFHLIWILIFQLLLGRIATTISTEYLEATKCPFSRSLGRGSLIVRIIQSVDTAVAVIAVIRYERRMKNELKGHRSMLKLVAFKTIVFIQLIQDDIFSGLAGRKIFAPTAHVSYFDFSLGTPAFMLCCEMFLFSILFVWAFEFAPYRRAVRQGSKERRSIGTAVVDVLNIMDIIRGLGFMFQALKPGSFGKRHTNNDQAPKISSIDRPSDDKTSEQVEVV